MIFTDWNEQRRQLWGNAPVMIRHNLSDRKIFSTQYLADLMEDYPEDQYTFVRTGNNREWIEGKLRGMRGSDMLEAIKRGSFFMNLRHVHTVDPKYRELVDEVFEEIHSRVPDLPKTSKRICGVLISGASSRTPYHFDTTLQSLWQIHGSKEVFVYPASEPFLKREELSDCILYHNETRIGYEPWYDEYATRFDLDAGYMLNWPLNAPHRIVNKTFSVSLSFECMTWDARVGNWHTAGDGLLPKSLRWAPWPVKAAAVVTASKTGTLNRERQRRSPIAFQLTDHRPEG